MPLTLEMITLGQCRNLQKGGRADVAKDTSVNSRSVTVRSSTFAAVNSFTTSFPTASSGLWG